MISTGSVSLFSEGVQNAGELTQYIIEFKTTGIIPFGSYVKIFLPENEFEVIQYPKCNAFPISGKTVKGQMTCQSFKSGTEIEVTGFVEEFLPDTSIGLIISLKNPGYAHITSNFGVAILKEKTQIMYERKVDIAGVPIKEGIISSIVMRITDES